MKRKLHFLMMFLLMIGGVSQVWADNFSPTLDVYFRTSLSETVYSWNPGFPKTAASLGDNNMAGNHRVGMFVLQKYSVANLKAAKTITLKVKRVASGGGDALGIWAFNTNEWSESSTAADLSARVNSIVGLNLNTTGTPSNSPLVNGTSTITDDVCSFAISGAALTTLKAAATYDGTTGTFTLLITNKTSDMSSGSSGDRKFYASGHSTEINRPYVAVEFDPIVLETNSTISTYTTLNAAFDAVESAGTGTITLYDDATITSRCNIGTKTITVVPVKAGITVSSTLNNSILILGNGGHLTVGSADYQLTIDGGGVTNSSNTVEGSGGTSTFKNVKFYNCVTSSNMGIVCHKSGGNLHLENVLFDQCTTTSGRGIVFAGSTGLFIDGTLTFTDCNEYNIYQESGRFLRVGDISSVQAAPITLYNQSPSLKQVVLSSASGGDKSALFQLMNDGFGIIKDPSHSTDHKLTEASEQTITDAGASTLVLPFEAKIPAGVTAYTLTYSGGEAVSATEVTGATLAANTPVLLNAEAGTYKYVNTSLVDAATTGSDPVTVGVLTGVYAETIPGTGHYILTKHGADVGFRQTVASSKVAANRAYLTAGSGARDFLYIDFLDDETTDIMKVSPVSPMSDGIYYDLQGRKVARPVKGMYIVNGKKVIVK